MVASYAWAAPGGVLQGTQDLVGAFMQYPVQLDQARRSRAAMEFEQGMARERMGMDRERLALAQAEAGDRRAAEAFKRQIAGREAVREGLLPPSAPAGVPTDLADDEISAMMLADADPSTREGLEGYHFERDLAKEGAGQRSAKQAFLDAQTKAMLRQNSGQDGVSEEVARITRILRTGFDPATVQVSTDPRTAFLDPEAAKRAVDSARAQYEKQRYIAMRDQLRPEVQAMLDAQYGVSEGAAPVRAFVPGGSAEASIPAPVIPPQGPVPALDPAKVQALWEATKGF